MRKVSCRTEGVYSAMSASGARVIDEMRRKQPALRWQVVDKGVMAFLPPFRNNWSENPCLWKSSARLGDYASLRPGLQALLGLPGDAPASLLRRLKTKLARLIDEMRRKQLALYWVVMDMRDMRSLGDVSIDLVVDEGAQDPLMTKDTPAGRQDATRMLRKVHRVLAPCGRYCCV
ncbi:hypothetical protein PR001_g11701 [Phytophthora rubi]|uniref:Uncharacterized protein n=1 Tax=Phytophthora rubi TaxID=129364 RepID=A0A6A3MG52_9STRA|nr:hypothetical protein PR001_g11701 [Phytophthora rubi]